MPAYVETCVGIFFRDVFKNEDNESLVIQIDKYNRWDDWEGEFCVLRFAPSSGRKAPSRRSQAVSSISTSSIFIYIHNSIWTWTLRSITSQKRTS